MSKYGVAVYGVDSFGPDPDLARVDFSVLPFQAQVQGYSTQFLTWQKPQASTCTILQLVRNRFNVPTNETDGFIIFSQATGLSANYLDTDLLPGFSYYSMFGWDSVNDVWVRCGDLSVLTPINWGFGDFLYQRLPAMYRNGDFYLINGLGENVEGGDVDLPLQNFLEMLGVQFNILRTYMDSLLSVNDPTTMSGDLLPLLAQQMGMPYESEIGMDRNRLLVFNAAHLFRIKGSSAGISEFINTFTGWPVGGVRIGPNRLLYRDDCDFFAGGGSWTNFPPSNGVNYEGPIPADQSRQYRLTVVPNLTSFVPGMPNVLNNYNIVGTSQHFSNNGLQIQSTTAFGATTTPTISTGAIPIRDFVGPDNESGGVTYSLAYFTPLGYQAKTVNLWVTTEKGNTILRTSFTSTPGSWNIITVANNLDLTQQPNFGNWVIPVLQIENMVSNDLAYITMVMVTDNAWNETIATLINNRAKDGLGTFSYGESSYGTLQNDLSSQSIVLPTPPNPELPRDLKIILEPELSNLFGNPLDIFNNGLDGWISANPVALGASSTVNMFFEAAQQGFGTNNFAVNGVGSLGVEIAANGAAIYGGGILESDSQILPTGWFVNDDWFNQEGGTPGGTGTPGTRTWFEDGRWFFEDGSFFHDLSGVGPGVGAQAGGVTGLTQSIQGTDTGQGVTGGGRGDLGSGAESAGTSATLSSGDTGSGSEVAVPNEILDSDSGSGSDVGSVSSLFVPVDSVTGDWFAQQSLPENPGNFTVLGAVGNQAYTLSSYIRGDFLQGPTSNQIQAGFIWIHSDGTVSQVTKFLIISTSFGRYSYTVVAPADAVEMIPFFAFPSSSTNDYYIFNSAMVNPSSTLDDFLDSALNPGNTDYIRDSHGASYFYPNREVKTIRLVARLPEFLPLGASYTLEFAAGESISATTVVVVSPGQTTPISNPGSPPSLLPPSQWGVGVWGQSVWS